MRPAYLALDLGGTKTEVGVVDAAGSVLGRLRVATQELRSGGDPLGQLIGLGRRVLSDAACGPPAGVGVALPGPADAGELRMLAAPTIPELERRSLREPLEAAFGCPARGENDANACALAEALLGAARGAASMVYVTVSTGIGGGAVLDGKIYRGARGTAAEFGHQVLVPEGGPACECGSTGCLEALASGRAILARAREAGLECSGADDVARLVRSGDQRAGRVWEEAARYLGLGLANVINLFDPEIVVMGGGVVFGAGDLLLEPARDVVRRRCMPSLARPVPIRPAALGSDLGLLSAAVLVMGSGSGASADRGLKNESAPGERT